MAQTQADTHEAVIVDAVRTPVGKFRGALREHHPVDLLATTVNHLVERSGVAPEALDDVIIGVGLQVGEQSGNVARNALLGRRSADFPARGHSRPAVRIRPAGRPVRSSGHPCR